ncbi:MAG: sugar phosphate isomerase/epimerase [Planctomycetes bacterium]|nr:sugar phosphate isomerase/epimerase [Planctomycetota bacterium]
MKLGLVTYNLAADWDLDTLIRRCGEIGLSAVEFRTTHKHGIEPSLSKEQRKEVRRKLDDSGLSAWSLGSVCEYHSPDPAVLAKNMEDSRRFVELAADLGAKGVKVRPNGLPKEVSEDKTLEQIGRSLHAVGEMAAAAGVEIWCEMHGGGTSEPSRMRKIMDIAGHPKVGVTWNSNGVDVKDGSVRSSFELMKGKIYWVHINELVGGYPYRELFSLLNASGYDRYTLIEGQALKSGNQDDTVRFLKFYKALWEEWAKAEG